MQRDAFRATLLTPRSSTYMAHATARTSNQCLSVTFRCRGLCDCVAAQRNTEVTRRERRVVPRGHQRSWLTSSCAALSVRKAAAPLRRGAESRPGFVSPRDHIWTESREYVQIALGRETNLLARISRVPRAADSLAACWAGRGCRQPRPRTRPRCGRPTGACIAVWNWPIRPSRTCSMTSWRDSIAA